MFSFRGRIGRWDFFKGCMALAAACLIPAALAMAFIGPIRDGNQVALPILIVLLVAFAAVVLWIGLALQAKRLRDIGWAPLYVLPAWFVFQVLDSGFAMLKPQFAVGHDQHQTAIGAVVNLILFGAMMFWPGNDGAEPTPSSRNMGIRQIDLPGAPPSVPAIRPVVATGPTSFGRRGLAR